jgi:hypothetical protein
LLELPSVILVAGDLLKLLPVLSEPFDVLVAVHWWIYVLQGVARHQDADGATPIVHRKENALSIVDERAWLRYRTKRHDRPCLNFLWGAQLPGAAYSGGFVTIATKIKPSFIINRVPRRG